MKLVKRFFLATTAAIVLAGCTGTKDVQYVQDMTPNAVNIAKANPGLLIEPDDLLSIVVTTKNPELGTAFNMQPGMMSMSNQEGAFLLR